MTKKRKQILDDDGVAVTVGCVVNFCYGCPPVGVRAKVIERDGKLIALTPGHKPTSCPISELRRHVGSFYVVGAAA